MAYAPIALIIPQYAKLEYANWWLKAYEQGTTTPLVMATDAAAGTTLAKAELDSEGFPITAGSARFIPFINGDYDLWLFPTAAEADANDTTNAIQFADNLNADPNAIVSGQFEAWSSVLTYVIGDFVYASDGNYYNSLVNSNLNFEPSVSPSQWNPVPLNDICTLSTAQTVSGVKEFTKTQKWNKGADIVAANDLILLDDGNSNDITGTTTVNGMTDGDLNETRHFHADGAFVLKHNTSASSGFSSLHIVQGAADITTSANDEWDASYDGAVWRVFNYQRASSTPNNSPVLGTVAATTSGTEHDFTGILSWATSITVSFSEVSLDAVQPILVQIGDSGGIEATGYSSGSANTAGTIKGISSSGFIILGTQDATKTINGSMVLTLLDPSTNTWIASSTIYDTDTPLEIIVSAGKKLLTGTLTQLRVKSDSGAAFDNGKINIRYS